MTGLEVTALSILGTNLLGLILAVLREAVVNGTYGIHTNLHI